MSELKESYPVQTAEFACVQGVNHEPAFNWWVKHALNKRDRIIASIRKLKTSYLQKSHKFVIDFPETENKAYALNTTNGNTLWVGAISKEMDNVRVAFDMLSDWKSALIGQNLYDAIWYSISKCRISDEEPGLWQ